MAAEARACRLALVEALAGRVEPPCELVVGDAQPVDALSQGGDRGLELERDALVGLAERACNRACLDEHVLAGGVVVADEITGTGRGRVAGGEDLEGDAVEGGAADALVEGGGGFLLLGVAQGPGFRAQGGRRGEHQNNPHKSRYHIGHLPSAPLCMTLS